MKKAVLILAALLLVSSLVSAQDAGVKIGGWGRGIFAVVGGDDVVATVTKSWTTNEFPRIGINVIGNSANVGFQIDINADGSIGLGDQVKIWVKPIDMVTVQLGVNCYYDALRGNASYGAYNWLRFAGMPGDGQITQRVSAAGADYDGSNFQVIVTPIEGLTAFASLDGINGYKPGGTGDVLEDVVQTGAMYGAGYAIPGIGLARVQYLAMNPDLGVIEAAFRLSAVPGLNADLGVRVGTDSDLYPDTGINLFASYAVMPTLTVNAIALLNLQNADADPDDDDMGMYFGVGADYGLEGGFTITADVRLDMRNTTETGIADVDDWANMLYGFLISIQKNFSNGIIGIGFEATNSNFAYDGWDVTALPIIDKGAEFDSLVWAVPVRLEFWF